MDRQLLKDNENSIIQYCELMRIGVINIQISNVHSLKHKLSQFNFNSSVIHSDYEIRQSDLIIFPGVGNFSNAMKRLKRYVDNKEISEDQEKYGNKLVQELTDEMIAEIDSLGAKKEAELLQV